MVVHTMVLPWQQVIKATRISTGELLCKFHSYSLPHDTVMQIESSTYIFITDSLVLNFKIIFWNFQGKMVLLYRECVSTGAAGAQTRRSLGHHLLQPQILRPRALFYRTDCRSKFLMHALKTKGPPGGF